MNKKILGSLAAMVAVLALVAGGTFAGWTDFHEVNGSEIGAGSLVLNVVGDGVGTQHFDVDNLTPGEFSEYNVFVASLNGDAVPDAQLSLKLHNLDGSENGCDSNSEALLQGGSAGFLGGPKLDPAAGCADLTSDGQFVDEARISAVWSTVPAGTTVAPADCAAPLSELSPLSPGAPGNYFGSLNEINGDTFKVTDLAPGEGVCIRFRVFMDNNFTVTDASQGDDAKFDVRFDLTQI